MKSFVVVLAVLLAAASGLLASLNEAGARLALGSALSLPPGRETTLALALAALLFSVIGALPAAFRKIRRFDGGAGLGALAGALLVAASAALVGWIAGPAYPAGSEPAPYLLVTALLLGMGSFLLRRVLRIFRAERAAIGYSDWAEQVKSDPGYVPGPANPTAYLRRPEREK